MKYKKFRKLISAFFYILHWFCNKCERSRGFQHYLSVYVQYFRVSWVLLNGQWPLVISIIHPYLKSSKKNLNGPRLILGPLELNPSWLTMFQTLTNVYARRPLKALFAQMDEVKRSQDYLLFPLFHCFSFQPNNSYLSTKLPTSTLSFVLIFSKIT